MTIRKPAVIVDIDGTIALRPNTPGARGPFNWDRVLEDEPNQIVIDVLKAWITRWPDNRVILVSGRDSICRVDTEAWLFGNKVPYHDLYMRPQGSFEKDTVVKKKIYNEYIKPYFRVEFVLDDRDSVVQMWREELNLTCFQVAPGAF